MANVPAGSILGFFENGSLKHAMLYLGGGKAAGNKNACLDFGNPCGWEVLDLGQCPWWQSDGTWSVGGKRKIDIHHKPVTELA